MSDRPRQFTPEQVAEITRQTARLYPMTEKERQVQLRQISPYLRHLVRGQLRAKFRAELDDLLSFHPAVGRTAKERNAAKRRRRAS